MDFTKVKIYTTSQGAEVLTGLLIRLGITGFEVEDSQDFERFLADVQPHWDYVDEELLRLKNAETSLSVYLADNEQGADMLKAIRFELDALRKGDTEGLYGRLVFELCGVREEDWANNWKQYFKPIEVGRRFLICPSWELCEPKDGRLLLSIDPSSSFGTGGHHTTQLCIECLEDCVTGKTEVLDMGCGSGILSVAALLLGAAHVTAVDIDQSAVQTACDNVQKNGFDQKHITARCANVLEDEAAAQELCQKTYDVIAANIVADVIIAMSGLLKRLLKPSGTLVCSGIIYERASEVEGALAKAGLAAVRTLEKQDWAAIVLHHAE